MPHSPKSNLQPAYGLTLPHHLAMQSCMRGGQLQSFNLVKVPWPPLGAIFVNNLVGYEFLVILAPQRVTGLVGMVKF